MKNGINNPNYQHGFAPKIGRSSEYNTWKNIRQRCFNSKNDHYYLYGGRGITVCDRWKNSFESFLEDMGKKPTTKHSIDRINNDGNYEPGNCHWATTKEQNNNQRKNNWHIDFGDGLIMNSSEIARQWGVAYYAQYNLFKEGKYKVKNKRKLVI